MEDLHEIFGEFKREFPTVYSHYETLGKEIHEKSGPIPGKLRWLLKIVISGAASHTVALETHIRKGKEAGLTDNEIKHALLLLIQTVGFPTFMRAYQTFKNLS